MGLFSFFKKITNKTIGLLPSLKDDLVILVRPKHKGEIKVGSEILVDEGFVAVLMHIDNVCDTLPAGTFKFDQINMPKLYQYLKPYKTKKGYQTPNSLEVDIYYVNLKVFANNPYRTIERVMCKDKNGKSKLHIIGHFDIKAIDGSKLIKGLRTDFAIIKKGVAINELIAIVGLAVSEILNTNIFTLEDYQHKSPDIVKLLNEYINKVVGIYGVECNNITIEEILFKNKKPKMIKQKSKKESDAEPNKIDSPDELLEKIEGLREAMQKANKTAESVIYVTPEGQSAEVQQQAEQSANTATIFESSSSNANNYSDFKSIFDVNSGAQSQNINIGQPEPELLKPQSSEGNQKTATISSKTASQSNEKDIEKTNTKLINEIKQNHNPQNKCKFCGVSLAENAKFCYNCGKSVQAYVVCECCGAKNLVDATECVVCKSKLI